MSVFSNYRVRHKQCHGEIIKRTCSNCGRHWGLWEHWTTFDYYSQKTKKLKEKGKGDPEKTSRKLTGNPVTDALPAWPRWARITSTLGIVLVIAGVIYYVV